MLIWAVMCWKLKITAIYALRKINAVVYAFKAKFIIIFALTTIMGIGTIRKPRKVVI
jgi:hypothetical protein